MTVKGEGTFSGIVCRFIDTGYNEERFFGRHACFLGAGDPSKSLKRSLKSEINKDAWKPSTSTPRVRSTNPKPAASW